MIATNTPFGEHVRRRPSERDPEVRRAAAVKLLERAGDYNIEIDNEASERDRVLADILSILDGSDAYHLARDLEFKGWDVDAQVVDWLEGADTWGAQRDAVKAWVKAEGIVPALAVGTVVTVKRPFAFRTPALSALVTGEITRVDADEARYTVFVEELGHVRKGTGTHGIILDCEEVESANVPSV